MTLSWATIVGAGLAAWVLFISPSSSMPSWKTVGLSTAGVVTASLALLYKFQERLLYAVDGQAHCSVPRVIRCAV